MIVSLLLNLALYALNAFFTKSLTSGPSARAPLACSLACTASSPCPSLSALVLGLLPAGTKRTPLVQFYGMKFQIPL
jgi:hypothetical protein